MFFDDEPMEEGVEMPEEAGAESEVMEDADDGAEDDE